MPLLRLLHQITNMYQNVKEAQNELREQPGNSKRVVPLKDESSLASEVNDLTLIGSIPDAANFDNLDEQYDKFNESYQIGHSVSRTRMPTLGPLIPLTPSPSARNRPQSFAQKLKSTSKSVKGKLGRNVVMTSKFCHIQFSVRRLHKFNGNCVDTHQKESNIFNIRADSITEKLIGPQKFNYWCVQLVW